MLTFFDGVGDLRQRLLSPGVGSSIDEYGLNAPRPRQWRMTLDPRAA
jgi:hypothetical protein